MNERLGNGAGWRCPACQNVSLEVPTKYTCFCGKMTNPPWSPRFGIIPHSCGEVCKKKENDTSMSTRMQWAVPPRAMPFMPSYGN